MSRNLQNTAAGAAASSPAGDYTRNPPDKPSTAELKALREVDVSGILRKAARAG
jgi:hypothetical protein